MCEFCGFDTMACAGLEQALQGESVSNNGLCYVIYRPELDHDDSAELICVTSTEEGAKAHVSKLRDWAKNLINEAPIYPDDDDFPDSTEWTEQLARRRSYIWEKAKTGPLGSETIKQFLWGMIYDHEIDGIVKFEKLVVVA